nr:hypothetical protein [Acidimicrobiia bacterium]
WPVAVAAAIWTAALAHLLRSADVTYATWAATALAYGSALVDAGYEPLRDPVLLTWPVLALLGFSVLIPRRSALGRLDVPPFVVGLVLAIATVGAGAAAEATATTWAPIGGALLIVAALKREWVLVAPLGSLLIIGAAGIAGPWYLTFALAVHAAALGVLARFVDSAYARSMQWLSASLGGGAWASLMWALEPSTSTTVAATAAMSAAVAVVAAVLVVRDPDVHRHSWWSGPWVSVAALAIGFVAAVAVSESVFAGARWTLAGAVLAWLAATVVAASYLDVEELRLAALAVLGGFVAVVGWAGEFSISAWSIWTLSLATFATTAGAAAAGSIDRLGWRTWFVAGAGSLHVAGALFAAQLLPDRGLLILALVALCGASVVADLVFGVRGARYLAPGFGFGAWITFVTELGSADVQWYAPPFAVALLIDIELARRQRRSLDQSPTSTEEMVVVELVAMALAIGPALAQVVFEHLAYGLLAIGWGAVIAIWGTATRVRRRAIAGAGGAALGALLMIAVPLAELLPEFRGPALWAAVFGVGAVLIAVATTLEQTRRRFVELKTSFVAMTEGWE